MDVPQSLLPPALAAFVRFLRAVPPAGLVPLFDCLPVGTRQQWIYAMERLARSHFPPEVIACAFTPPQPRALVLALEAGVEAGVVSHDQACLIEEALLQEMTAAGAWR